jgi:hypothetical protein
MANLALSWLGSSTRLLNINQGGAVAAAARDSLAMQVPVIQELHPWNCCVTRESTPATSSTPIDGAEYAFRYQLRPDCLRWLPWRRGDVHYFEAEQEGAYLLANCEGPLVVRYIRHEPDPTKWTPLLAKAVTAQLAFDLCEAIAASQSIRDRMAALFDDTLADAKRSDALATGRVDRPAPQYLSRALAAMGGMESGDAMRWHR